MKPQQLYWPQHKVFFIATLALFPEKIQDVVMTITFYTPYFASDDVETIELTLQEYEKDGYIKFKKLSEGAFKIIEINSQKAINDLTDYLKEWKRGEVTLLAAKEPIDKDQQQKLLQDALVHLYKLNLKDRQHITLEDVYGLSKSSIFGIPFWEPLLSLQLLRPANIKITRIDYDRLMNGIYPHSAQPFADIEIISPDLRNSMELTAKSSKSAGIEVPKEEIKYELTYNPTERILRLNDVTLANPQYSSENHLFLEFFVTNKNTGTSTIVDLLKFMKKPKLTKRPTQILGDVRITKDIKIVFFPNASTIAIEFRNPIYAKYAAEQNLPEIDLNLLAKTVRSSQK